MDSDVLVKVEGVSKKFCRDLKRSLWYGVKDISSEILGISPSGELRKKEFWAVNDVSFELRRGECLGLIGHNGAGKSTLLKMLNGLIKPDKGRITMKGRIGALIELGAGFNPILTGRENIYNNGAVLGFSKKEIDKKLEAIIDFAEIEEFIDTPVQNYSSGMKVRLGFAVAAQMEPDVLIIDEVLAVGDIEFKVKCLNRIYELLRNTSVIFVSHSMPQIARVASSLLLMEKGSQRILTSDIGIGIEEYYGKVGSEKSNVISDFIEIREINIDVNGVTIEEDKAQIKSFDTIDIKLKLNSSQSFENVKLSMFIVDKDQKIICGNISDTVAISDKFINNVSLCIPKANLSPGKYILNIVISKYHEDNSTRLTIANIRALAKFIVGGINFLNAPIIVESKWNVNHV